MRTMVLLALAWALSGCTAGRFSDRTTTTFPDGRVVVAERTLTYVSAGTDKAVGAISAGPEGLKIGPFQANQTEGLGQAAAAARELRQLQTFPVPYIPTSP
jgi:hypothetical protein